ncbi:MAG: hypothetical protein NXI09_06670 [Bacteroidetes bacterium]|nr:hypothetical protein [Bacteroidota bacterium]
MKTPILALFVSLSLIANAQYNSLGIGAGSSFFRGETTATGALLEEPGLNLYGYYSYWLPADERFQLIAHLNFDFNNPKIQSTTDGGLSYEAHTFVLSPLFGLRFYLDKWLMDYVPEKNQDAFFAGVYIGPALSYADYQNPSMPNARPDLYNKGIQLSFNSMTEVGYRIFRNEFWSYEVKTGFQYGFYDGWDGYKGSSGINDWIFHLSLGMSYSFYKFR